MILGGPENFLARLGRELNNYDLPPYRVINPNIKNLSHLKEKDIIKIGRLDGVIYYKMTTLNFYNLLYQRKDIKLSFIKKLPNFFMMLFNKPLNNYLNRANRAVLMKSDILVFQSDLSKKMHEFIFGQITKPYRIILNGVPTDKFYPDNNDLKLKGFPKLVITASFRLHKRLQDAIDITNHLKVQYPKIKLHIIGDMDILTKEYIHNMDLSSCIFHGRVDSEDLSKWYGSSDIGLSLSIFDPCPNSVVEMMACGLPVITNSSSGASELLNIDDLIIKDDFAFKFMELQTAEKLPKVNIELWSERIIKILESKKHYKNLILERVNTELDIKIVAEKYANFIVESHNAIS